jgi:hypothetical protein
MILNSCRYLQRKIDQVVAAEGAQQMTMSSKAPIRIATIIIESGSLYSCLFVCKLVVYKYIRSHSLSQITVIVLFKWNSVAAVIVLDLLPQMAVHTSPSLLNLLNILTNLQGILPTLIMLLVHLDITPGGRVAQEYDDVIQRATHVRSEETAVEWEERHGEGADIIDIRRHDILEVNVSLVDGNTEEK